MFQVLISTLRFPILHVDRNSEFCVCVLASFRRSRLVFVQLDCLEFKNSVSKTEWTIVGESEELNPLCLREPGRNKHDVLDSNPSVHWKRKFAAFLPARRVQHNQKRYTTYALSWTSSYQYIRLYYIRIHQCCRNQNVGLHRYILVYTTVNKCIPVNTGMYFNSS